jgi:hypothetical protein
VVQEDVVVNPYIVGVSALVLFSGGLTTGWKINGWRHDSQRLAIEQAAAKAGEAATMAAAEAIKQLRPVFTTINRPLEKEIRGEVRYISSDCSLTPPVWSLLDRAYQAAGGQPFTSGTGLPDAGTASGSDPR